jgi:hypothetical protein
MRNSWPARTDGFMHKDIEIIGLHPTPYYQLGCKLQHRKKGRGSPVEEAY